jgi:hypothetical protein
LVDSKVALCIPFILSASDIPVCALQIILQTNLFYLQVSYFGEVLKDLVSILGNAILKLFDDAILSIFQPLNESHGGIVV